MKRFIVNIVFCASCVVHLHAQKLVEKASEIGIDHVGVSIDHMGGGIAFFDFDNDGFEDLAVSGGINLDRLYRNLGNGRFVDVTISSGLTHEKNVRTMGVNAGDINNDGFKDLILVTGNNFSNLLYLNNGDGTFTDISISAGFGSQRYSLSSILLDINLDGLLDMYIVNWVDEIRSGFLHKCYPNQLYLNNGDLTFTEVSEEYGVNDAGCGVAAVSTDINFDHIPDLYVVNDFGEFVAPSSALINNFPEANFAEIGSTNGLGVKLYGMGVCTGDINNDGLLDYYTTSIGSNALLKQTSVGAFEDITTESATDDTYSGKLLSASWGAVMVDLDHDGYEEILVANGYIATLDFIAVHDLDTNRLYKNFDGQHFEDKSVAYGFFSNKLSRGIAVADYDNDGDMDVGVLNIVQLRNETDNLLFYENQMSQGNWLKLKLQGTINNRDGYGTKVLVYTNGVKRIDELQGGSSCSSLNSSFLHFGLGDVDLIDSVEVIWPGGYTEKYFGLATNKTYLSIEMGGIYTLGCTTSTAENYDSSAEVDFGCFTPITGCMDPTALNYNPLANTVAECEYEVEVPKLGVEIRTDIQVFPTSVKNKWMLQMDESKFEDGMQVQLIDLNGRLVYTQILEHYQVQFDRPSGVSGLYIVRVLNAQSEVKMVSRLIF